MEAILRRMSRQRLIRDLKAMLEKGGKAYGCVEGLDGYGKSP